MADVASLTNLPASEPVSRPATLADDTPVDAPPAAQEATRVEAQAEPAPTDKLPADEAQAEPAPTDKLPADEAQAEPAPTDKLPADEAKAEPAPTEKLPADEAQTEPAPTGKPSPTKPAAAPAPSSAAPRARPPAPPRRGGWLFSAFCAVISLAGAAVALTAPTLRPQAFDLARAWLGETSPVLRYMAAAPASGTEQAAPAPLTYPPPSFQAPASVNGDTSLQAAALAAVRAEMIATLRLELDGVRRAAAEQGARLAAAGASARAAQNDAAAARTEAHAAATAADGVVRAQDAIARAQDASTQALNAATERLDRLEAQVAVSDARGRATGMVVAAAGLHRDIISGASLHDDLAALADGGPLPVSVQQALDLLARSEGGVPTLRDLGVGFEAVDAAIVARGGGQGSWFSLSGWFGGANAQRDMLVRLRALAAEGRFSEVADTLERTEWADLAQRWAAQVRQRSAAVIAGQTVLAHAQAAYEAAQTTPPAWPQTALPAGQRRTLP